MPFSHPSLGLSVFFLSFTLGTRLARKERIQHWTFAQHTGSPKYAERRAELRRKAREAARARQTAAASQNEAEESDESGEETAGERTTRVGRTRGGMKVAARIGDKLRREIGSGRRPRVGDG